MRAALASMLLLRITPRSTTPRGTFTVLIMGRTSGPTVTRETRVTVTVA